MDLFVLSVITQDKSMNKDEIIKERKIMIEMYIKEIILNCILIQFFTKFKNSKIKGEKDF